MGDVSAVIMTSEKVAMSLLKMSGPLDVFFFGIECSFVRAQLTCFILQHP